MVTSEIYQVRETKISVRMITTYYITKYLKCVQTCAKTKHPSSIITSVNIELSITSRYLDNNILLGEIYELALKKDPAF